MNFRQFVDEHLNPGLYDKESEEGEDKSGEKEHDYFWVENVEDRNVSFLGLNSAWACEDSKKDRLNIALGYPQLNLALKKASCRNRIVLFHHPLEKWMDEEDIRKCEGVLQNNCSLILQGHSHFDLAYKKETPTGAVIYLGANASYTVKKDGFVGFQFIDAKFNNGGFSVRVWPYILDSREENEFFPDTRRWKGQKGKPYFDIGTLPGTAPEHSLPVPLPDIPTDYRDWIKKFHSTLSIDQLSKKGEVIKISLPELYIHIETGNPFYKPEKDEKEKGLIEEDFVGKRGEPKEADESKEPSAIDIETLLSRVNCILLRGPAGMGKTTLIKHLSYTLTHEPGGVSLYGSLPVPVFFKDLWPIYESELKSKNSKITFEYLLETYLEERRCPLEMKIVKAYLSQQRAVFLLDGVDEVPAHLRPTLMDKVAEFQFDNRRNRFLITGRPHGIAGKVTEHFGEYLHDINPLESEKVKGFITSWFRIVMGDAAGVADATATGMIADIEHNEHISVFTQNPLLLTAVCILYQDGKRLPEQRADLYQRIVDNLLYKRFHDPADSEKVGRIEDCLRHLAFTMQQRNLKKIEVSTAVDLAKGIFPPQGEEIASRYRRRIEELFNDIEPHCGLLDRLDTGEVEFSHLTFQEFLAAGYMMDKGLDFKEFLRKEWWEEAILLYIGLISLSRKKESNDLVQEILQAGEKDKKAQNRLYLLGAKALRDIQAYKRDSGVVEAACRKLTSVIESGGALGERFEAGELLGILGDFRIESTADNMVMVEAGEFIRGSESEEAQDREKPERKIYLDEFLIGKYPVTNREYKEFVEAGGYENEESWTPEGWQWREKGKKNEPLYRHDRKWNGANFPVVGVSWYEACAYAKWLSIETGKEYRLPTEAEWEKAARGVDGRIYPWSGDFDKDKCNCWELGLGRTSPVGIFPGGASPYGCVDMSGNVWEWCSDWFDEKYYKKSPGNNPKGPDSGSGRVLRGGSWRNGAGVCRASYRDYVGPGVRVLDLGFRLSLSL